MLRRACTAANTEGMRRLIFPDAVIHDHRNPGGSDDYVCTSGIDLGDPQEVGTAAMTRLAVEGPL